MRNQFTLAALASSVLALFSGPAAAHVERASETAQSLQKAEGGPTDAGPAMRKPETIKIAKPKSKPKPYGCW